MSDSQVTAKSRESYMEGVTGTNPKVEELIFYAAYEPEMKKDEDGWDEKLINIIAADFQEAVVKALMEEPEGYFLVRLTRCPDRLVQ